jgi:hypothetical protein
MHYPQAAVAYQRWTGAQYLKWAVFFFEELAGALLCHIRRRASQSFTESYYIKKQKTQALKTLEGNISSREQPDVRKPASVAPTLP